MKRHSQGFTLIELLVVISIIALLIGILLPALGAARRTARQLTNSTQLRGIHQGMVTFAQENKGFFPGIDGDGTFNNATPINLDDYVGAPAAPSNTIAQLLNRNYFSPEYCNNPADSFVSVPDTSVSTAIGPPNFSYVMIELNDATPIAPPGDKSPDRARADEWRDTLNSEAVMISDKNTGGEIVTGTESSVWTEKDSGEWRGTITRNDNSTTFETSPEIENTRYGNGQLNDVDNLFLEDGGPNGVIHNDAAMINVVFGQYHAHGG